ncbi:Pre-mRNA processing factor 3 [Aphelenchoides besseyi]|nr:Pre-mRNA processing factor 3 [Aphelenchoides besseyi]KAI6202490.1 Pre-mRNA processing factor 3 [Aphelenchoides besseyi]
MSSADVERKRRRERDDEADDRRSDRKRHRHENGRDSRDNGRDRRSDYRDRYHDDRDRRKRRSRSRSNERSRNKHSNGRVKTENGDSDRQDIDKDAIAEELRKKQIFQQAKITLQEKIHASKGLLSAPFKNASALKPEEAVIFADTMLQRHVKVADMQKDVAAKIAALQKLKDLRAKGQDVKPLIGSAGTPFSGPPRTKTELAEEVKPMQKLDLRPEIPMLASYDQRVQQRGPDRGRRQFKFAEQGTFQKIANQERTQAKLAKLRNEISQSTKHTGISSAVRLAIVTPSGVTVNDDLPEIEWWDRVLLGSDAQNYDSIPSEKLPPEERYVGTLKPPDAPLDNICLKASRLVRLTKKESKRLRRMDRLERQREEQEKIRLGLEKPPEPKVKISNLMRVLGNDAIQDPTKMESYVRNQMAERLRKHQEANAERKLTKEQRSEKKSLKIMEDTSVYVYVAVYKVLSLANPQKRFKVLQNAKQLHMTGTVVSVEDMHVIVVEGGAKQQRFYKNLMLNRIHWNEEMVGQKKGVAKEDEEGQRNECVLIWEGTVANRAFQTEPRIQTATDHKTAREIFVRSNVPHYWDHCFSHSVLLSNTE